ncbi:MAG: heparan-alpha-glucosaminide N-acetyltransferase domain-containing protein [Ferruginibacter sp.]
MTHTAAAEKRIQSIDVLRGLVMVIMALDHVRDFFYRSALDNASAAALDPTNLKSTFPALFFTRWITHFCAPTFVFLSGVSVYLMSLKKTKKELSVFLITRGTWLVLVELIIITFAWTFNPAYNNLILQVIWALGVCMLLMGLLVWLPYKFILVFGLVIFFGHNLLDLPAVNGQLHGTMFWDLAYFSNFAHYSLATDHGFYIVYPFLPWLGVMSLGFCFGKLYTPGTDAPWRRKKLLQTGFGLLLFFIVLRLTNVYGDPVKWETQERGPLYTFLSFLNITKYPPSLLFLSITIGAGILFLAFIEKVQNGFTSFMNVFGRVPMLYYILHMYLIHILVVVVFYMQGFTSKDIVTPNNLFNFRPGTFGFGLFGVYAVWLFIIIALYPVCKKYNHYKSTHKHWWLSYL